MKVITVLSGGMDSVALLYWLERHHDVAAISFDYDQKHSKELNYARVACDALSIRHRIFNLSDYSVIAKSALTQSTMDVPEGHYAAESMKATVVPNRNMTMLSIATAWAISSNANAIATGIHSGDHAIYPDCRPEFIYSLEQTLKVANEGFIQPDFQIIAPWLHLTKSQIAQIGTQLNVPWEKTWSCYKGGELHCGKCGTCVERREAFELAAITDPTSYEDGITSSSTTTDC
jgi:7-cyano-7-deazaguanine synthase